MSSAGSVYGINKLQTQLAIGRELGVVVTTNVSTRTEAKKEKETRRIKTSTVTRIAASLLCIGDAVSSLSCCSDVHPPAYYALCQVEATTRQAKRRSLI